MPRASGVGRREEGLGWQASGGGDTCVRVQEDRPRGCEREGGARARRPFPAAPRAPPAPLGGGGFAGPRLVLGARAQMWQGGACDLVVRILAPATGRGFLGAGRQDPVFSGECEPRGSHTQSAPWLRMWEHSRVSKVPVRASGCGAPRLARLDSDSPANPHRPPSLAAHSHPRGLRPVRKHLGARTGHKPPFTRLCTSSSPGWTAHLSQGSCEPPHPCSRQPAPAVLGGGLRGDPTCK